MNTNSPIFRALLIGVVIGIVIWAVTHRKPRQQPDTAETPRKAVSSR